MNTTDCLFCKIIEGEIPSEKVYEDGSVTAFHDINPAAPTHLLIVPKKHIAWVNDLVDDDEVTVGHLFTVAKQLANQTGIAESGYRLIINNGPDGGQVVYHLHLHLLGGKKMGRLG
jgi:histidine triad (HIT) family protein